MINFLFIWKLNLPSGSGAFRNGRPVNEAEVVEESRIARLIIGIELMTTIRSPKGRWAIKTSPYWLATFV